MWVSLLQSTGGLNRTKGGVRGNLLSLPSLELAHGPSQSLRLELTPVAPPRLQLTDGESWDFSASRITGANSLEYTSRNPCPNMCMCVRVCILLVLFPGES